MEQGLPFHQQLRYERERRGWSQADLAGKVNSDFKTVHRWESGKSVPRPYYRQILCDLFGKSAEELGLIEKEDESAFTAPSRYREDWGEAPLGGNFYGRDNELLQLKEWIDDQRCHVIALLGIGGIGKTTLAVKVAEHLKNDFEYVFWRSLQNTPLIEYILKPCLQCLSGQQHVDLPDNFNGQLLSLVEYLRKHRCLLVLDNVESIMQEGRHDSHYCHGYEAYGRLIQCIGEAQHQSCLLLTSREKPKEIALLEGRTSPVRTLYLRGIECHEGRAILKDKGLLGSDQHWRTLVDLYSGNPLALKLVSDTICEVFGGDIERFLWEEEITFGYLDDLIGQQFSRLSMQEREILYWLAIERQAVPLETLCDNLAQPVVKGTIFAALDSLLRRSFVETRNSSQFLLQPAILEHVTNNFVKRACEEFVADRKDLWVNYVFAKAQSEDYIRESQKRLIVAPIAQRLLLALGRETVRRNLEALLVAQRQKYPLERNYIASNVLQLFMYMGYDLRDVDVSHLVVWQAHLQDIILQRVNFAHAHFISSVFKNTFGNILSVAFSPLEHVFAMGTAAGEVWMYQAISGTALTNCLGHTDGVWSVTFHPNGHMLASSSDDQTIRLWDIEAGHCFQVLRGHTNRVRSVTFSPDGHILASGSDDQTIRLWNVSNGSCFLVLQGHTDRVWSVAFSPDGRTLATGSTDKTIRLWDVSTGHCFKVLTSHTGWVRSVIFSPKGETLASGSDDQTVRLWDSTDGCCLHVLQGHINRVWSITFSPDGKTLASGSEDKSIRLWDVRTGTCLKIFQEHTHGVRSIAMSFSGQMLVSGGDDQTVRTWELHTGVCLKTLRGYTNRIWSVAFDPKGDLVVSSSEDQSLRLWNVTEATCCKVFQSHTHGAKAALY